VPAPTATVQIVVLAAAMLMLIGGAFIVYRRSTGWGPLAGDRRP
jgi:hypothetical protein